MANTTVQTVGLILKEQKVSENDRLITVLTKDLGLVRAFSSGSLKSSSKSLSATAFLSYSRLVIYKGSRDTYKINDAHPEKIFWDLRNDFTKLSLASYFCEVCMSMAPKDEPADEYLRLTLNCLHLLSQKESLVSNSLIKAIFELRMCLYSGYMPDVDACHKCNCALSGDCFFDISGGVFYCNSCEYSQKPGLLFVPAGVLTAMQYILSMPLNKCFAFKLSDKSADILCGICEKFLIAQTGRSFDTLEFYKTYKL